MGCYNLIHFLPFLLLKRHAFCMSEKYFIIFNPVKPTSFPQILHLTTNLSLVIWILLFVGISLQFYYPQAVYNTVLCVLKFQVRSIVWLCNNFFHSLSLNRGFISWVSSECVCTCLLSSFIFTVIWCDILGLQRILFPLRSLGRPLGCCCAAFLLLLFCSYEY